MMMSETTAKRKSKVTPPPPAPNTEAPLEEPKARTLAYYLRERWTKVIVEQKPDAITLLELKDYFDTLATTGMVAIATKKAAWPEPLVQRWLDQGVQEFYGGEWETWCAAFYRKTQQIVAEVMIYVSGHLLKKASKDVKACASFMRMVFPDTYVLPAMRPLAGAIAPATAPNLGSATVALPEEVLSVLRDIDPGEVHEIRRLKYMLEPPKAEDVVEHER